MCHVVSPMVVRDSSMSMYAVDSPSSFDNHLNTSMEFHNDARRSLSGVLNTSTVFAKNEEGESTAYIDILESRTTIGDTTWHIHPARVTY
jgi:hypothetical protein